MSFDREYDESNNGMQCLLLHYIMMNVNQRINHEIIKLIHGPIGHWDETGHIALVSVIIIIDCDLLLANDHHSRGNLGSRGPRWRRFADWAKIHFHVACLHNCITTRSTIASVGKVSQWTSKECISNRTAWPSIGSQCSLADSNIEKRTVFTRNEITFQDGKKYN